MKRIKHKKAFSALLVGAAVLSVGTVGFSAWIITGGTDAASSGNIGVQVATVDDQRIQFKQIYDNNSRTWDWADTCTPGAANSDNGKTIVSDDKAYVIFGPKYNDSTGYIQASGNGLNDLEHLSISVKFTLTFTGATSANWASHFSSLKVKVEYTSSLENSASASSAISHDKSVIDSLEGSYFKSPYDSLDDVVLIQTTDSSAARYQATWDAPQTQTVSATKGGQFRVKTAAVSDAACEITVTASWNWGTLFAGLNPGDNANDSNQSTVSAYVSHLQTMSSAIGTLLGGLKFTFTAAGK